MLPSSPQVTSKPDLYPLVFTCNANNDGTMAGNNGQGFGKNGTGYLMVHYFRNYIVRPVGSLSATSTVDSLSSSFICTVNEANTIVPPPYSRAASPGLQQQSQQSSEQVVTATGGGTTTTPLVTRLDNAQSQQNCSTVRGDLNQISRSESMQQERVVSWTGGGGEVRETQQMHYFRNSNSYNNDNNDIQESSEGLEMSNHNHHPHPFHHHHQQQQVLNHYRSLEHHHPAIKGRSLSAPLADEEGEEVEVEQGRRATRDWGNSCYANVDCSTGCGRERYHNQQQQQQQMQRRSVGSTTMNVDVVVETVAGNRQSGGAEMKSKMSGSQNNETVTVPMNGRTMAGLLARSRTPSFEKKNKKMMITTTLGSQNNIINGINNSSGNVLFIDSEQAMASTGQQHAGGSSSSVCCSRSEYELRKLRSSFRMRGTTGAGTAGATSARSVEEKSLRGEGKVIDRVRSLEGNGEAGVSGQLMGFSKAELDYYHQMKKRPKSSGYQKSYNNYNRNEREEDGDLINVTGEDGGGGEGGGNCQMDRLTAELNELFIGVERALRSVPLNDEEEEDEEKEVVIEIVNDEEQSAPAAPRNEVLEKSFSDMRLDLAARARLMQRQMSVDQDQSSVLSGFLSSMSMRRDYLLDSSPSMLMLHDNHNNKSGGLGGGNPLFDNSVYLNSSSNTGSAVSSLVNMDCTPSSPPQATSPTDEMRDLLEQISQLQRGGEEEEGEREDGQDVVAEEERIIGRLRRDSERERIANVEAVVDEQQQGGNPEQSDWMLMMKKRNKSEGDNNNGAVEAMEEKSIAKTRHGNSNNKSTKRPLSFQNNSHRMAGSLNLPVSVDGQDEEEEEEVDPFNFHSCKAVGTSLNSTHSRCSNSRSSRDAAWEEEEEEEKSCSNYDRRPRNSRGSFGSNRNPNKSFYLPVATHSSNDGEGGVLRSPLERSARKALGGPTAGTRGVTGYSPTSGGFLPGIMLLGQAGRKFGRLSRSAPTTPGTVLPPNKFDDVSPLLLDEQQEEEEEHV